MLAINTGQLVATRKAYDPGRGVDGRTTGYSLREAVGGCCFGSSISSDSIDCSVSPALIDDIVVSAPYAPLNTTVFSAPSVAVPNLLMKIFGILVKEPDLELPDTELSDLELLIIRGDRMMERKGFSMRRKWDRFKGRAWSWECRRFLYGWETGGCRLEKGYCERRGCGLCFQRNGEWQAGIPFISVKQQLQWVDEFLTGVTGGDFEQEVRAIRVIGKKKLRSGDESVRYVKRGRGAVEGPVDEPDVVPSGSLVEPGPDEEFFGRQDLEFPMARRPLSFRRPLVFVMRGDVMGRDAMKGDMMRGDVMRGDVMRGDVMRGDVMGRDAMKGDVMVRGDVMVVGDVMGGGVNPAIGVQLELVDECIQWFETSGIRIGRHLTSSQRMRAIQLLYTWKDLFISDIAQLPATDLVMHTIPTYPNAKPHRARDPIYAADEIQWQHEILPEWSGVVISPCASSWVAKTTWVAKKDTVVDPNTGERWPLRMVHTYCQLNDATIKTNYPIKRMEPILEELARPSRRYFFSNDAAYGFTQYHCIPHMPIRLPLIPPWDNIVTLECRWGSPVLLPPTPG